MLTPAATLVLGVLAERPAHPYDVLATLRKRRDDRLVRLNPGAVYHAVDRLEAAGLVEAVGVERAGNRPERTLYAATAGGRVALHRQIAALVAERAPEYPRYPVGLALLPDVDEATARALLSARRDAHAETVAALREGLAAATAKGVPPRFLLDVLHDLALEEAELAWAERLLGALQAGELRWDEPAPPGRTRSPLDETAPHGADDTAPHGADDTARTARAGQETPR